MPTKENERNEVEADVISERVSEVVKAETDQGFRGVEVDQTPNENYTVAGVLKGLPTPESETS